MYEGRQMREGKRKTGSDSFCYGSYMLLVSFRENYACGFGGVAYSGGDLAAEMRVLTLFSGWL